MHNKTHSIITNQWSDIVIFGQTIKTKFEIYIKTFNGKSKQFNHKSDARFKNVLKIIYEEIRTNK